MDDTKKTEEKQEVFPEAGAVGYFGYKRTDGFEISLTLRDKTGAMLLKRIDGAIKEVVKAGGTPLPLRGGFAGKQAKPVEYVPDRLCPTCQNKLVYGTTKAGKRFIKCSTQRYDFTTRQTTGCPYVDWGNNGNAQQPQAAQPTQMSDVENTADPEYY